MTPWSSEWWEPLVAVAERGGHTAEDIVAEVQAGKAILWPVAEGCLVLARTADDFMLIWLCAGRNVRSWWREAEKEVGEFARSVGCVGLRLEGRQGWRRILPHWQVVSDEDMILMLENGA